MPVNPYALNEADRYRREIADRDARRIPLLVDTLTIDEIAKAYRYVFNEYTLVEGTIDGEQWAEGLAFATFNPDDEERERAREAFPQLNASEWKSIVERARYLRKMDS